VTATDRTAIFPNPVSALRVSIRHVLLALP